MKLRHGAGVACLLILGTKSCLAMVGFDLSSARYPSIQATLDANPGKVIEVPAGVHEISATIRVVTPGGGLSGFATITQTDSGKPIVRIDRAPGATLRGLTLTRPEGRRETGSEVVFASDSSDLSLVNLRVIDNQTQSAAIELRNCANGQIRNCLVQNYQRVGVDDRTDTPDHGFAYRCIIGKGILIRKSQGTLIQGNRVRESRLVATPEIAPPRYRYAVLVESGTSAPVGLHFSNNIFHPGAKGVSNVELKP